VALARVAEAGPKSWTAEPATGRRERHPPGQDRLAALRLQIPLRALRAREGINDQSPGGGRAADGPAGLRVFGSSSTISQDSYARNRHVGDAVILEGGDTVRFARWSAFEGVNFPTRAGKHCMNGALPRRTLSPMSQEGIACSSVMRWPRLTPESRVHRVPGLFYTQTSRRSSTPPAGAPRSFWRIGSL
jgi:hypothetical protein